MQPISLTNKDILEIVRQIDPANNPRFKQCDDVSTGQLFADVFKDVARFNTTANEWYIYDGIVWRIDERSIYVDGLAQRLVKALHVYAVDSDDNYRKYTQKLFERNKRVNMLKDARNHNCISQLSLDADGDLFNCQNCIINLKTFEILEHDPKYLLSKVSNVVYKPAAKSQDFEKFMNEVMENDVEKIRYLQRLLGYALTSENTQEECYMLYGSTTRNGKGTLTGVISHMMGDYARNTQPETIAQKKRDSRSPSEDIARLYGCRFLNMSEPPKRMIFDVALIKTMLGRDVMTARFLNQNSFEFIPTFKLFINTNYLPIVNDDTLFSSGRIKVVTFDKHFSKEEQDTALKGRLMEQDNISGIFNWCLDGLKEFYKIGTKPPAAVENATDDYREKSDKIGNFFKECFIMDTSSILPAGQVYKIYQHWCVMYGYGAENKGNFYDELKAKGLIKRTGTYNGKTIRNVVKGYKINQDSLSEFEKVVTTESEIPFR